jgi:hypothetical protein
VDRFPLRAPSRAATVAVLVAVAGLAVAGLAVRAHLAPRGQAAAADASPSGRFPAAPPVRVCDDERLLRGPAAAPPGALVVPAGDNSRLTVPWNTPSFSREGATFWFAPGVHTLGPDRYAQIVPGRNSTFIGAPGAVLDGLRRNNYAFGGSATGVTISHLRVENFVSPVNEGVVNHDPGSGWTFRYNTITRNEGAGLVLGTGGRASYNCLKDNGQYGFIGKGADGPGTDLVFDHNEVSGNNTGDWESRIENCGCTGGGKFWDVRGARVTANYVHDNKGVGLWADTNNADFLIEGNWIEDNDAQGIFYEISYNAVIRGNVVKHNVLALGRTRMERRENWPDAAIYISESGGDSRVQHTLVGAPVIDISGNLIQDNYNGVTLWEGSNRFCNSPANTSSGYCTLVRTGVVKLSTCVAGRISTEPYYSDCRWKTQNVTVHDNVFDLSPANFENCSARFCGHNAILSDWGTYPDWSPYQGPVIGERVTLRQGNTFVNNTYRGDWHFVVAHSDQRIDADAWRAAPYRQDVTSTFAVR